MGHQIVIRNLRRQPTTISLGEVVTRTQKVGLVNRHVRPDANRPGRALDVTLKVEHRTIPESVTLMAKGTPGSDSEPLPAGVEHLPDVKRLLAARPKQIEIVRLAVAPAPEPDTAPPPEAGTEPETTDTETPAPPVGE